MRTITLFFTALILISGSANAKRVDVSKARTAAIAFLSNQHGSALSTKAIKLDLVSTTTPSLSNTVKSKVNTDYYIFNVNNDNGFVIVSADDIVFPILAYSDQKGFDPVNIPAHVAGWMEGYLKQIEYAISLDMRPTPEITEQWDRLLNNSPGRPTLHSPRAVNPLITTHWDQSPYYNDLCPYDNNYSQYTVTGCVATAMAQVLKYWQYPANGSGFHSYSSANYGTLSADFGNTAYNWSNMPSSLTGSNQDVATLMFHCGVSVDMNYGVAATGGSSAYVLQSQSPVQNCAEYAMKTYFGYSSLQGAARDNYPESQWISMLKTDLDASRPVLYAGIGSGGGHCFVCDGYDINDLFHFNWGWSGQYDGYFNINALNPGGVGTGGGTGGFNSNQQALLGVQPPSGNQTYDLRLYDYVTPSASTIYYGQAFSISTNIGNYGSNTFNGDFCAAIFDNNYTFIDFVQILTGASLQGGSYYTSGLTFTTSGLLTMLPGSYYIGIYYRTSGNNWYLVDNNSNYSNLVQMDVINPNPIELYAPMTVTPGSTLTQGQAVSVHLDVINTANTDFSGTFDVSLYNLDGTFAFTIQQMQGMTLTAGSHYINGLTFSNPNINANPGTYLLAIQHLPSGGSWELTGSTNYQNPLMVVVQEEPLSPDIYEPNNTTAQAYLLPLNISGETATISTQNANCHTGNDYDFYKINLPAGYTYNLGATLYDAASGASGGTLTGIFSISADGTNFSQAFDGNITVDFQMINGGSLWFLVSPKYTGTTGTYRLEIGMVRYPLGVNGQFDADVVTIYPNPASDRININLNSSYGIVKELGFYDIYGKELQIIPVDPFQKKLDLPVNHLADGVYFLRFLTDNGTFTRKITVSR